MSPKALVLKSLILLGGTVWGGYGTFRRWKLGWGKYITSAPLGAGL